MTKKVLYNNDLFAINTVLNACINFDAETKFFIYVHENLSLVSNRVTTLNKLREESKEYKTYVAEKNKIALSNCELNSHGDLKLYTSIDSDEVITKFDTIGYPKPLKDKKEVFDTAIKELNEQYKLTIDSYNAKLEKFNNMLKDKVEPEIKFIKIPESLVPKFPKNVAFSYTKVLMPLIDYKL